MKKQIPVIKKNERYYLRISGSNYHNRMEALGFSADMLRINGEPVKETPGSPSWVRLDTFPSVVEVRIPAAARLIGFKLKDAYANLGMSLPERVDPSYFGADDDDDDDDDLTDAERERRERKALYEPEFEQIPERWDVSNEWEFTLVDEDCEPLEEPAFPFRAEFPYLLDFHPVSHYKYPCIVSSDDAFEYVRKAVTRFFNESGLAKNVTIDYTREYLFCVTQDLAVTHSESRVEYRSTPNSRKPTTKIVPVRTLKRDLVALKPANSSARLGDIVPQMRGDNYFDLKAKLDAYAQDVIQKFDTATHVCDKCHGYGVTDSEGRAVFNPV